MPGSRGLGDFYKRQSGEGESIQRTDFTVIAASVSYRPAQSTAWPRTYGPQTAKVVGPQGESI
ncbi:hypothetical protein, partial [Enterobacter hormaechei]